MATDFSDKFNDMLAPYQEQAQNFNSPYAFLDKNSSFVGAHPRLAGLVDNGLLSAAMVPEARGPEGVGGGISRALQGPLEANQFMRDRALKAAMLPYQMLEPRLKAEDTLAQIDLRNQQGQHQIAMDDFYKDRVRHMQNQDDINQQRADTGAQHQEDLEEKYQKDPLSRITGQGGIMGAIIGAQMSNNPDDVKRGERMGAIYKNLMGGVAGAKTTADKAASQPFTDTDKFLSSQFEAAKSMYPKIAGEADWHKDINNMMSSIDNPSAYNEYVKGQENVKQTVNQRFAEYQQLGLHKQKIPFNKYVSNPGAYQNIQPDSTSQGNAPSSGKLPPPSF